MKSVSEEQAARLDMLCQRWWNLLHSLLPLFQGKAQRALTSELLTVLHCCQMKSLHKCRQPTNPFPVVGKGGGGGGVCLEQKCSQTLTWCSWTEQRVGVCHRTAQWRKDLSVCLQSMSLSLPDDGVVVQQETGCPCLPAELLPLCMWHSSGVEDVCISAAVKLDHMVCKKRVWYSTAVRTHLDIHTQENALSADENTLLFCTLGLSHIIRRLKWE